MTSSVLNQSSFYNPAPPDGVDVLETSSILVEKALSDDRRYVDLSDLLKVPSHNQPSVSGTHDEDYPSLAHLSSSLVSLKQIGNIKKIPLPQELLEQYGRMQCHCSMGLFPEIGRAWLSVDSDIFIWRYEDGEDLAYFDGLSETIFCAGLLKPKAGIFQPHIQYLLCLATPIDIVLLGVRFTKSVEGSMGDWNSEEMHLLPDPLFSIPTDNVQFVSVVGTENGRIFMAGKDSCLYELVYQAEDGWFSRKCRKVNHSKSRLSYLLPGVLNFSDEDPLVQISVDDSRHVLFTRSDKGTIQVYDLGSDGWGMTRVAAVSQHTTCHNATALSKVDRSAFKSVVHIAAIPQTESINCHLVAITNSGVRLYFTTCSFGDRHQRPCMLSLIHVRLPPGFSPSSPIQRPVSVCAAQYSKGLLMLFAAQTEDSYTMWSMSPDVFPFQRQLHETFERLTVDGKPWAVAEVPTAPPVFKPAPTNFTPLQSDPPAVVNQHNLPDRKFVIINSQFAYVLRQYSPVEQLKMLLLEAGPDSDQVQAFFALHKEQACATSLVLACNQSVLNKQVAALATRAFFLHGGEPEHSAAPANVTAAGLQTPGPGFNPLQISTPYPNVTQQLQFTSPGANSSMVGGLPSGATDVVYSFRHRGLCLFFSRIVRTFWECPLVTEFSSGDRKQKTKYLASTLHGPELDRTLELLLDLKDFVDQNSQFSSPLLSESFISSHNTTAKSVVGRADESTRRRAQAEAEAQENVSLKQLQQLIHASCETFSLWKVLTEHQFHVLMGNLTKDQQNSLKQTSYRTLVTQGKDVCNVLITNLIKLYLADNAATDAISAQLREVCPSLYTTHDQMYSKGNEILQTAKTCQNKAEKESLLLEALNKYKEISEQLDLPAVCEQFAAVRFYPGIVQLSLAAALKRDPQGYGLHFYKHGEPPEDQQGLLAFNVRMDCYKCITEALDYLLTTSQSHPQALSVPHRPGPPPRPDPNMLSHAEAEAYAEEVFSLAVGSEDELFHVHFYDWLISKNLSEKLLQIKSPYLEPYLKRMIALRPDHVLTMDLLWRYYEKSQQYSPAARILAKLAELKGSELKLSQRKEYLSRATMCAKSSTLHMSASSEGEFLHELEEKTEVVRLQLMVYDDLTGLRGHVTGVDEALCKLDSELVDITTLYNEFAERFDMSLCKLAILQCAGHNDLSLVELLWQDIVDKELEVTASQINLRSKVKALQNKLVMLGRTYASTEKYFPLAYLIKYLEKRMCEVGFDEVDCGVVFNTMLQIGITLPRLHEILDRLYKSKDPVWQAVRRPFHLLRVIHLLLDTFANSPSLVPAYQLRHFTTVAQDSVAHYLVVLQAESSQTVAVHDLITNFRSLQAKLNRLN